MFMLDWSGATSALYLDRQFAGEFISYLGVLAADSLVSAASFRSAQIVFKVENKSESFALSSAVIYK